MVRTLTILGSMGVDTYIPCEDVILLKRGLDLRMQVFFGRGLWRCRY